MEQYTVKKLSKIAGISVRTLHHYDEIGLLKPSIRTDASYRLYGHKELVRLQQILFYKELDFPLRTIQELLNHPSFDNLQALQNHRKALIERKNRLATLLKTIDNTILTLKGEQKMLTNDELYAGFSKNTAQTIRQEAIEKYGVETVQTTENNLRKMDKAQFEALKKEGEDIATAIAQLMHLAPSDEKVQEQIHRHHLHIVQMWGGAVEKSKVLETYKGLADLYVQDNRFYADIKMGFNSFISQAMLHYVNTKL
jgi:DNA-binding transcriptional MerR regulator